MSGRRELSTGRLLLRRWREADREPFAAMNADRDVMEYFPARLNPAASDQLIARIEAGFDQLGYGLWALELRATGEFLGFTGLAPASVEARFTPAVEVGWRLARRAWGQGYATEAASAALAFGFGDSGLSEIVSFTSAANVRSRAVMERVGMTHDPADDFDHRSRRATAQDLRLLPGGAKRMRRRACTRRRCRYARLASATLSASRVPIASCNCAVSTCCWKFVTLPSRSFHRWQAWASMLLPVAL
jgi:RimJ/RimL family protein N-acetyltransferase